MKILCVGRGYIGKALATFDEFDIISHQEFLENPNLVAGYDGVVNTAGIVGQRKCDEVGYKAVIKANVNFASCLQSESHLQNAHFIQLSTVGISYHQTTLDANFKVSERMRIYPHNLYCASKILCEQVVDGLKATSLILRLPWVVVPETFKNRIQNWKEVQATYCSILIIGDLRRAILEAVNKRIMGICNIKTADVYFPVFITESFGLNLPERGAYPVDITASVPMDTSVAIKMNLSPSKILLPEMDLSSGRISLPRSVW